MTTTVTKSIGTSSRDYSTVQAWEDALPANLVTGDTIQVGECYNDSEFSVAGTVLTVAGETTDSTHTITLKCASGQSFKDNANVQTNALRYNQSNGVGLRRTSAYNSVVIVSVDNVSFIGLQFTHTGAGTTKAVYDNNNSSFTNVVIDQCIFEMAGAGSSVAVVRQRAGKIRNSLIIQRLNSGIGLNFDYAGTIVCVNNTIVRPSDVTAASSGLSSASGTTAIKNVAVFGFTNEVNNSSRFTATTCATDKASPMTGFTGSLTYTSQFQTTTDASRDFRAKSGGGLIDAGTTDTTNGTPDIAGTARPSGSAYDIGCWELVQASGVNGTLSITLADLTATLSGSVSISGTLSKTLDNLTTTLNGGVLVQGTLSKTLDNLTTNLSGTVAGGISGTLSATLADITSSLSGAVLVSGTLNSTLGDLTKTLSGGVLVSGTASNTLGNLSTTLSGAVTISGTLAKTLDNLTISASGTSNASISGTLNTALGDLSGTLSGSVSISGTLSATLGSITTPTVPVTSTGTGGFMPRLERREYYDKDDYEAIMMFAAILDDPDVTTALMVALEEEYEPA